MLHIRKAGLVVNQVETVEAARLIRRLHRRVVSIGRLATTSSDWLTLDVYQEYKRRLFDIWSVCETIFLALDIEASCTVCVRVLEDYLPEFHRRVPGNTSYGRALAEVKRQLTSRRVPVDYTTSLIWFDAPGAAPYRSSIISMKKVSNEILGRPDWYAVECRECVAGVIKAWRQSVTETPNKLRHRKSVTIRGSTADDRTVYTEPNHWVLSVRAANITQIKLEYLTKVYTEQLRCVSR